MSERNSDIDISFRRQCDHINKCIKHNDTWALCLSRHHIIYVPARGHIPLNIFTSKGICRKACCEFSECIHVGVFRITIRMLKVENYISGMGDQNWINYRTVRSHNLLTLVIVHSTDCVASAPRHNQKQTNLLIAVQWFICSVTGFYTEIQLDNLFANCVAQRNECMLHIRGIVPEIVNCGEIFCVEQNGCKIYTAFERWKTILNCLAFYS